MFKVYGAGQSDKTSNKPQVDFDALNSYVVETANLQQRETLVGYVSMIVDLGTQEQPDAEVVFTGSDEDERKEIAEKPATYFKDGIDQQTKKQVRLKCWPQRPIQCVAVAVDFPDIMIDKGKFFGESKPLPLRLWLGDQFFTEGSGMVIARPTPLKINKKLGSWSFDQKHLFYKMAVAAKLTQPGQPFLPQQIDQLLGKAFQFEAQVFFKESKGKKYYTEYVKFVSGLGRGQVEPPKLTQPLLIQFDEPNPEQAIKELRSHVVNTMKRASNYQGSIVQKEIDALRGFDGKMQSSKSSEEPEQGQQNSDLDDFDHTDEDESLPF